MRAIVVMPPTREGPTRTYAGCTCSISVNEALEIDLPVRDGPAGPDDGGTVYGDFSMLPDELGQRAARALMSMAAALRGDDSEYPWSEPDPVGVGIALQAMSCLPDRNTIGNDGRNRLSDPAAGGPDSRPVREDAGALPGEGEGTGVREARRPGALPAKRPGRMGDRAAARLHHGRRDRAYGNGPTRGGARKRHAAGLALIAPAAMTLPGVTFATTDTTSGEPLDTVQDIVGGTRSQLVAAPAVGPALRNRLAARPVGISNPGDEKWL